MLSDSDLAQIIDALHEKDGAWSRELANQLERPMLVDGGKLSEYGKSAAIRMAREMSFPDDGTTGVEEARRASLDYILAQARLEISLVDDHPMSPPRLAAVEANTAATNALRDAAVVYIEAVIERETR
jgi:hypothetical protein